jgi:serine/threonine protein kinase
MLEIEILSRLSHVSLTPICVFQYSSKNSAKYRQYQESFLFEPRIVSHPLPFPGARLIPGRYIFTDLAPAGDLFSYAQSHGGHLDDYSTRAVTLQIAQAVEYLHSQGIAHRDIKQENVLVTTTDFGGRVLLTDFGFATYTNVGNGRMLSKVGTNGFVAP